MSFESDEVKVKQSNESKARPATKRQLNSTSHGAKVRKHTVLRAIA